MVFGQLKARWRQWFCSFTGPWSYSSPAEWNNVLLHLCFISSDHITLHRQRGHIRPNEIQEPTAQLETSNPLPLVSQASKKSNWIRINVRVRLPSLQNKSPMGLFFCRFVFFMAALCVTAVIHPQERRDKHNQHLVFFSELTRNDLVAACLRDNTAANYTDVIQQSVKNRSVNERWSIWEGGCEQYDATHKKQCEVIQYSIAEKNPVHQAVGSVHDKVWVNLHLNYILYISLQITLRTL